MRIVLRLWHAVDRVADRENAGVETEAFVVQNVQGPKRFARDRIAGGSVSGDGSAAGILEHVAGQSQGLAEFLRRLPINKAVPITMAADLRPPADNFMNQSPAAPPAPA